MMAGISPRQLAERASIPLSLANLVFDMVEKRKKCSLKRLRSDTRAPVIVRVRWAIAREARRQGYTYSAVGRALNRDHSSIMYAVGAVKK